ncbi:MAG: hypothetical protein Q8R44_14840 [Novosphingobium sp.]|nr:hypothetical protein [Novosphingobium sp.]
MTDAECRCMNPPFNHADFKTTRIGVDEAGGRFAEVSIERCRRCGQRWLRYFFEIEGLSRSGRWYRGAISREQAKQATPANGLTTLSGLGWHFYGGSYFDTAGGRSSVPLSPEVL